MQALSRWGEWWDDPPPQHNAHYWAAKATLHEAHVKELHDVLLDRKWAALGFRRVTNWGCSREDLKVQPSFKHIQNLPILTRRTP